MLLLSLQASNQPAQPEKLNTTKNMGQTLSVVDSSYQQAQEQHHSSFYDSVHLRSIEQQQQRSLQRN